VPGLSREHYEFVVDSWAPLPSLLIVSSRLLKWAAVVTLTFALGAHWTVLQSVAWVTMAAGYSRVVPLKEALVKTFDGKHPCLICKFVANGKKSEQRRETQQPPTKIDLFLTSSPAGLCPPVRDPLRFALSRSAAARSETPPTPPPRNLRG